jgi:uncharacterized protein with HEPN domain
MPVPSSKLLTDALNAVTAIQLFVDGRVRSDLDADQMLRSAVERQFEVLGEAMQRLRQSDPLLAGAIPDIQQIIQMRNVISHRYDSINLDIVWSSIKSDLPGLRRLLLSLLA